MKDKHIVKPIDSSNWEQKDPIKHNHKQKSSLGSSIFAIIFLIWFFGSIVAMMIFADINEYITLILFGQVFFIMGLVAFFAKDISGKRVNLIGLPFIIVGLLCIVIPLCILFPNILPVEVNWSNVIVVLMLMAFVIVGLIICTSLVKSRAPIITTIIFGASFMLLPGGILSFFLSEQPEFIVKDSLNEEIPTTESESIPEPLYKEYKIGDKVTVRLNNTLEKEFYCIKNSDGNTASVTLLSADIIGYSAFNKDYGNGDNFEGSLIQTELNKLTTTWTSADEIRLITKEELINTGLTHEVEENRCPDTSCLDTYTYVNQDSFLYIEDKIYWTMTRTEASSYNKGYVYIVNMGGSIDEHIVGYEPGGEWNQTGQFFTNYGIRPVIQIDKTYIK